MWITPRLADPASLITIVKIILQFALNVKMLLSWLSEISVNDLYHSKISSKVMVIMF